jgi:hypothetical protein
MWPLWKKNVNYKCLMKWEHSRNYLALRRKNVLIIYDTAWQGTLWFILLWYVHLLLGNDCEISNYTTAVAKQRLCKQTWTQQLHCNRGMGFCTWSMRRCYKQDKWVSEWVSEWVREPLGFSSHELLLWEAGSCGRGKFRNPEEGEHLPLEVATKQWLVKTVTDWEDLVCPICEV